jgi:rubrerythrin
MSILFEKSNTRINLMKAFAGESQARNRYTFAASRAKKEGLNVIEKVFIFTANQEKEHADIFYKYLQAKAGQNVNIEASYPVDIQRSIVDILRSSKNNEYEEYGTVYKAFGDEAEAEGFADIAKSFRMVSGIEKVHGDRFAKFADLIENNKLFVSDAKVDWICLNCGYVHKGLEVPEKCPVCGHGRGYFLQLDLMPV